MYKNSANFNIVWITSGYERIIVLSILILISSYP